MSKGMLLQNVIALLSSKLCLGAGNTFPSDKSVFWLKQQVGYKSLGCVSENEKQPNQTEE